jgi:uncharacterized protein YbjT (DUF2867 family)
MKVLVTGATGIAGQAAVAELLKQGHRVRILSRNADEDTQRLPKGVEPWPASIGDPASLRGCAEGCDLVLHVAGIMEESPPQLTYESVNVEGTRSIVREAERCKVGRFIYLSSLGAEAGTSPYHRSKRRAEEIVRGFDGGWTILRPGNVYGPGDDVISLILTMVRSIPVVPVIGSGDDQFQPIWVEDLSARFRVRFAELIPLTMDVRVEPGTPRMLDHGTTITMALPLRGNVQVRVEHLTSNEATLVTLGGHPLAGAIRFLSEQRADLIRFQIQVYDRPANLADWVVMRTVGEGMQARSWEGLLQAMVEESGGAAIGPIQHEEESLDDEKAELVEKWVKDVVVARKRAQQAAKELEAAPRKVRRREPPPPAESHPADRWSVF